MKKIVATQVAEIIRDAQRCGAFDAANDGFAVLLHEWHKGHLQADVQYIAADGSVLDEIACNCEFMWGFAWTEQAEICSNRRTRHYDLVLLEIPGQELVCPWPLLEEWAHGQTAVNAGRIPVLRFTPEELDARTEAKASAPLHLEGEELAEAEFNLHFQLEKLVGEDAIENARKEAFWWFREETEEE